MKIINSTVHTDTQCSPNEMLRGIYASPLLPPQHDEKFAFPKKTIKFVDNMIKVQLKLLNKARKYQAKHTDLYLMPNVSSPSYFFPPGQFVVATFPTNQSPRKFGTKVLGPFQVLSFKDEHYTVLDLLTDKPTEYHFTRLRIFNYADYHHISPREIALLNSDEYDVEDILDHRGSPRYRSQLEFLVKFAGYDHTYNEWLSCNSVCRHPRMENYLQNHPGLRKTVMKFKDPIP
jgi:hypothetical protein